MWPRRIHVLDGELLRAIDRDLPTDRQRRIEAHLQTCEGCRERMHLLTRADELSLDDACGVSEDAADLSALRIRLRTGMQALAASTESSWWLRLQRRVAVFPVAVRAGAVVALALVVAYVGRPLRVPATISSVDETALGVLPIRALTPGATTVVDREAICEGRVVAREPIPASIRRAVLRDYRMDHLADDEYELDYLITPELGGIADPRNLWPERYVSGVWNAGVKDDLERLLPQLVCDGTVDLATAQRDIAENWIAAYKKYFHTDLPKRQRAEVAQMSTRG